MKPIPEELRCGPFTLARALKLGVTRKMLRGKRFVRLHPRVYRWTGYEMTWQDLVTAGLLALPHRVHVTGITRIQRLGLDFGPQLPVRFVVEGDHHLAIKGIFLHRTKKLAPHDTDGICIEGAFIAYCALARVIDAIKVGDWVLHRKHMDLEKLRALALAEQWRDGATEALWVSDYLNADCASLKESEVSALLVFAGLPRPDANKDVDLDGVVLCVDLAYVEFGVYIEYEGTQHQEDRKQYTLDIDRYALYRDHQRRYVLVTKEHLKKPREIVRRVHRQLVESGYDGPEPTFGQQWKLLFRRLRTVVGPRRTSSRSA